MRRRGLMHPLWAAGAVPPPVTTWVLMGAKKAPLHPHAGSNGQPLYVNTS